MREAEDGHPVCFSEHTLCFNHLHRVLLDSDISRHQGELFNLGLCDQKSVKGILMVPGQVRNSKSVFRGDIQRGKAVQPEFIQVASLRNAQFSNRLFD
jgi:hypothetical protein